MWQLLLKARPVKSSRLVSPAGQMIYGSDLQEKYIYTSGSKNTISAKKYPKKKAFVN